MHASRKASIGIGGTFHFALRVTVALAIALAAHPVYAATGVWSGGNVGTWDTSNNNWTVVGNPAWDAANGQSNVAEFATAGDVASISGVVSPGAISFAESASVDGFFIDPITGHFIGFTSTTSTMTVDVAATKTGTINADILGFGTAVGAGNKIAKTGAGTLVLAGETSLVGDADVSFTAGFTVEGGGELQVTGALKAASNFQAGTRSNFDNLVGSTSANNTLTVSGAGSVFGGALFIGEGAFGGNSVVISAPGSLGTPSYIIQGTGKQLHLGTSSSNNSLTVSNGAYFVQGGGGGTRTWFIGTNAGANDNAMLITGTGSAIDFSSNAAINVGGAGDGNSLTVSAGAYLEVRKILVGQNGGDNNSFLATGANTSFFMSVSNNAIFEVGSVSGSIGNSATIAAGATGTFNESSGTGRTFAIGKASGANDNYLLVTGNASSFSVTHVQPVSIGGQTANNAVTDTTASGNHIDVFSGGSLQVAATTSVYVMGVNSAINLGDGTGISLMSVGASNASFFEPGVFLKNADGRLNINSGRLTAAADGNLVSGPGMVDLQGTGYFSTAFAGSVITSVITGAGDLRKEGSGRLDLQAANSYTGDTYVDGGILELDNAYLSDLADVLIALGAQLDLTHGLTDTIAALALNNVGATPGLTYGSTSSGADVQNDTYFSGTGRLLVTAPFTGGPVIPTPAALPAGLAVLGLAMIRRNHNAARKRR